MLLVLMVAIYRTTFVTLWNVWMDNPNYSHGVLMPLVSGFLVWLRRHELMRLPSSPSSWGLVVIVAALGLQLAGLRGDVLIFQGDSFVLLLGGLVLHFGGWAWARVFAFPVGYLLFMVPFLPIFETQVSFRLRQLAASGAIRISDALGVLVHKPGAGTILYLQDGGQLEVANACSGMQSLISLLALGALFAYFARVGPVRRMLLFLASVPIALGVNVLRITSLCVVGTAAGVETATGLFHDVIGFVLFGIAFVTLLMVRRVLRC